MKNSNLLVSIIVATYNSSQYIIETLESAKAQTYPNIELIITDDGSTDTTIELCGNWIELNRSRFVRSEILTVEKNTGIPKNMNRGVKSSKGSWIKFIAGDDILLPNVIQSSVDFVTKNDFKIVVSKLTVFDENGTIENQTENYNATAQWFTAKSQQDQKKSYLRVPVMLNIPTIFYHRSVVEDIGYYDEEIRLLEDQPFIIKSLLKGYRIGFNEDITVKYRKHLTGVMQKSNMAFLNDLEYSFSKYIEPQLENTNPKDLLFKTYFKAAFFLKRKKLDEHFLSKLFLRAVNVMVKWS